MQVERLGTANAQRACDAVRKLKTADGLRSLSPTTAEMLAFLQNPANLFLVALEGDTPIGFAVSYVLDRVDGLQMMCLYEVAVEPRWRRHGVGTKLVSYVVSWRRDHDISKLWVLTNRSNTAAILLYASLGGVESAQGDNVLFEWR